MVKVIITGVAGLIGSHLSDTLLKKGYEVVGIDNLSVGKIENIKHNLKNECFLFKKLDVSNNLSEMRKICTDAQVIFHLSTIKKIYESNSSSQVLKENTKSTENMLKIARENKSKFIYASSSDVYGYGSQIPMNEDDPIVLGKSSTKRWSYSVSKLYGEHLCFSYYQDFDVPVVVLRYFGTFGERASTSWSGGHAMIFIKSILNSETINIHGDGAQTRTLCYVSDIVEGTIKSMETHNAVGEIINLGGTEEISIIDFAKLIKKVLNINEMKVNYVPFKEVFGNYKEIMRRVPDLEKAKRILEYEPKVSMVNAIKKTAIYVKEKLHKNTT